MGFFDDVFNAVTAPVKAFGGFFSDVLSGKNLADSAAQSAGKMVAGTLGAGSAIVNLAPIKHTLSTLSPYTLGITGTMVKYDGIAGQVNRDGYISRKQGEQYFDALDENFWKIGAIVVGGELAAGAGAGAGTVALDGASAGALETQLSKGNIGGAVSSGLGLVAGSDSPLSDVAGIAQGFVPTGSPAAPASPSPKRPPTVSGYSSSQSGYGIPATFLTPGVAVAAGAALVAVVLIRRSSHG